MTTIADLFGIEPTYTSKSGTGRTCATVQGYELSGPVRMGHNWHSSKKDARKTLDKWQSWATGGPDHVSRVRSDHLQWIVRILGADHAPTAVAELEMRVTKAKTRAEAVDKAVAEKTAFTGRVLEALKDAGFTQAELDRVSISAQG